MDHGVAVAVWEMHQCREAFEGLMEGQICVGVCDGSLRPEFDEECPADFRELTARCWAQNPETRWVRPHQKQLTATFGNKERR